MSDAADAAAALAFQHWFGLEPGSGRVLLALWRRVGAGRRAGPRDRPQPRLHAPPPHPADPPGHGRRSRRLRRRGYNLTETGRAECLAAIREIGDELTRAARGRA
jgi:hypothetical protein